MFRLFTVLAIASCFVFASLAAAQVPRPEHPRPQMVREQWLNLNGAWEFEYDHGNSGVARGMADDGARYSMNITVPFCPESELSGVGNTDFMSCVWYRRSFEIPAGWDGKRVRLHFGAVDYEATVWVNGTELGSHRGGYSAFSFDITDVLRSGGNTVVVRAYDDNRPGVQPRGKQCTRYESYGCHYTRTTGIWQTVWLEAVGSSFLYSFKVLPDIEGPSVTVVPEFEGSLEGLKFELVARADGKVVGRASLAAADGRPLHLELKKKQLWSVEDPFLYDLELKLMRGKEVVDRVESYFGLREVAVDGNKVLINGRPVFQRLVLEQGFYPDGIYTAPTDEALKRDIEISQGLGFNGARLHQKVFEPRFLYWADRLGYLVWGEYPNWGQDHSNPVTLGRMLPEWLEVLRRDFNHPSIVIWTPFNETPRSQRPELLRNVYLATKAVDPTRPVQETSGFTHVLTDIFGVHCYQQDTTRFRENFEPSRTGGAIFHTLPDDDVPYEGQPYMVSEYGGIWWNPGQQDKTAWGYGGRPRTESDFIARYRTLTETLLTNPNMFGFCYTQLYDIELEVNGLYTYDRRAKFDPEIFRRINTRRAAYENRK